MNPKRTVVMVTPYFPPHGGGLERYALEIATRLSKDYDWRIVVVTSGQYRGEDIKEEVDDLTVYRLAYHWKFSNTPLSLDWFKKIKKILKVENPDVINIHMPVPGIGDIASLLSSNRHVVVTYHAGSMRKDRIIPDWFIWLYEHGPLHFILRRADEIVCSSDFVKLDFLRRYISKSMTITPAVDTELFRQGEQIKLSRPTVLFVAGLGHAEQHKGLKILLKASQQLKNEIPDLLIAVVGDGDMRNEYENYAKKLGLKDTVEFKGRLQGEDLVHAYQESNVLVLPSLAPAESFGMVLIEAMACAVPVIGSNVGGIPIIIDDEKNGLLIPAGSISSLSRAIKSIINDPEKATRFGLAGLEKVRHSFKWDVQAKRYNDLFETIIKPKIKKKTILFLFSGTVYANFTYRGFMLAKELQKLGNEVSIIAPKADKYNDFKSEKFDFIEGVKIIHPFEFSTNLLEFNLLPYLFGAAYRVLKEKADVVYVYKPTPINIMGLLGNWISDTTVILDMDDIGSEVMRQEGHPRYQQILVKWCERLAARFADKIVAASTYLRDMYRDKYPNKPLYLLPNGVAPEWFNHSLHIEKKNQIVFLGLLDRKNILDPLFNVLPDILKAYEDLQVLIIGDGQCFSYFQQRAKELRLEKNVTFTGYIPINEARKHLDAGSIGYCYVPNELTIKAANNMKLSQYMACGVLPLVSDVGDLPLTVDFGNAGYIAKADDPSALKETILYALSDEKRTIKTQRARDFCLKTFQWGKLAKGFNSWLDNENNSNGQTRKQMYILTREIPSEFGGSQIRNLNLIKQLKKNVDIDIEVFCTAKGDIQTKSKDFESTYGIRCHIAPEKSRSINTVLKATFWERVPASMTEYKDSGIGAMFFKRCKESLPDIVQMEQPDGYYSIRPYVSWLKQQGVKIVFDCHNVESQLLEDSLKLFSLPKKLVGNSLLSRFKNLEIEVTKQSDVVLACSVSDANFFKSYNQHTYTIPNGVDCSEFQATEKSDNPVLLFMGDVEYPPNGDALKFYLETIHPQLKAQVPNIQLLAIGADREWLHAINIKDSSIVPLGFVDDVRPYLNEAIIGICPIRYGSGTRIKIMTYMSAGLAVVSTEKGAEGVGYTDNHNILTTDDPKEFAAGVLKLLHDKTYRNKIAKNGKDFILKHYDWNVIGRDLVDVYQNELLT